jgi:hypothetical protein
MKNISWNWVGIGAVIIITLHQTAQLLLVGPLFPYLLEVLGTNWGMVVYVIIISLISYFAGGVITGRLSPGVTCKEPGLASILAVVLNGAIGAATTGIMPAVPYLLVAFGIGYGFGYLGGKLGEAWQGHPSTPTEAGKNMGE